MENFREEITKIGGKALGIINDYLDGKEVDEGKVRQAARMIGFGVKVEHMNQVNSYQTKSIALRLVKLLPKDTGVRETYIAMTNPEVRPLLLARPSQE